MYYEVTYISPTNDSMLHSAFMQDYKDVRARWKMYDEMKMQFRIWVHYLGANGEKIMRRIK